MSATTDAAAKARFRLNSMVTAGGMLLQQALGFVGGVFVAKLLGPADYGEVSILRSLLALIIVFSPLGLDLALFSILPRYDAAPHDQALHFRRFRLIVAGTGIAIALIGGGVAAPLLGAHIYHYPHFSTYLMVTLLAVPFATDVLLLTAWYRVQGNVVPILLITYYFQPIVRTGLNVLAVYLGYGVMGVVVGTSAAYLASVLLALAYHTRTRRRLSTSIGRGDVPRWRESWQHFLEAPPMALNLLAYNLMRSTDLIIVGALAAPAAVGNYAIVSNISQLVPVAALSLSQTLGPTIARHHRAGDANGIRDAMNQYIRSASILSSFVFGGIAAFGVHLDLIFGRHYHPDPIVTILIPLGYLVSATLAPTGYALTMCGKAAVELAILIASAVLLAVSCFVLTKLFGPPGAAAAVLISFLMCDGVRLRAVTRSLGIRLGRAADLLPPVIAFCLASSIDRLLLPAVPTFLQVVGGCLAYLLLYGLIMLGRPALAWMGARRRRALRATSR